MALCCVLKRKKGDRPKMDYNFLQESIGKLVAFCERTGDTTLHMPRIGADTPGFNWYTVDRLIRNEICAKGVDCFVYYHQRGRNYNQRSNRGQRGGHRHRHT